MDDLLIERCQLRAQLKKTRRGLSKERQIEASHLLFTAFASHHTKRILSFSSFGDEIDTSLLNRFLARRGALLLPKMSGDNLKIFRVGDLAQLVTRGQIKEPDPACCPEATAEEIGLILVPGLGFDLNGNRIGYGKGYYDRFLLQISPSIPTYGIGFKEQLLPHLPTTTTDVPLMKVSLF